MRSNLIDVVVILKHETEKAWRLDHGEEKPVWLPKAWGEMEPNRDGKTHTLTIEQDKAEEKGFV